LSSEEKEVGKKYKVLTDIVYSSKGSIEVIVLVRPDGTPIDSYAFKSIDADYLSAATAAIVGTVSAVTQLIGANEFSRIDVQLGDNRHIIIVPYEKNYVACITKSKPNLGFVYIILNTFLKPGGSKGG